MGHRRTLSAHVVVAAMAGRPALGQSCPTHQFRVGLPFAAGGITDPLGRMAGDDSGSEIEQVFGVESCAARNSIESQGEAR
jgi:tripartite-type tricarboxylate transporter receptor subunit TctC